MSLDILSAAFRRQAAKPASFLALAALLAGPLAGPLASRYGAAARPQTQAPPPASPPATQQPPTQQTPTPATPEPAAPSAKPGPASREEARRKAWQTLNDGLAEKLSDRRVEAIAALGTIGIRPDVLRFVESGLEDKSLEVRQVAAVTLGDMKARSSIPKLRKALDDESVAVSFTAAQALWNMGDHSGLSIFVQVLAGERKTKPGIIHTQWHDMQEKLHDPRALIELGASETAGAFLGPGGFGITVIEELAKDKSSAPRAIAAQMLGHDKSDESREAVELALSEKSWVVRASAAEAMGRQGSPRDIDKLTPLLDDTHPEVRYSAAAAIVRLAPRPLATAAPKSKTGDNPPASPLPR
jgi:HEAT repeats